MENTAVVVVPTGSAPHGAGLPDDRSDWPDPAVAAFRDLQRDLDRWCRKHDWPPTENASVAEQAVRQCW